MVFLFNDVLFELGDLREALISSACPVSEASIGRMTNAELLGLVKETLFQSPEFQTLLPQKAKALSALVYMKTGANALLCLRAPDTTEPSNMHLRLGDMSLTVAGELMRRQKEGSLTPRTIDQAVWAA